MENQEQSTQIVSSGTLLHPQQHDLVTREQNGLLYYLTLGIRGILGSKKGSFCILILFISTVALFLGKVSGMEFVSAVTVISGIYTAAAAATDIQNMRNN